jgi:hypothetical protein
MATYQLNRLSLAIVLTLYLSLVGPMPFANAAVHFWQVREVFTNAAGTVQFVEMFDAVPGETFTQGSILRANSGGTIKDFVFPSNLTKDTQNKALLIATSDLGQLPGGVVPDFTFAQGGVSGQFINPNASSFTITFFGSGSSMSFTGAQLPKNGVDSIKAGNVVSGNSPQNLDSNVGALVPPNGDYNKNNTVDAGDYAIWRKTLNNSVSPAGLGADGDASGAVGPADYTFWRARYGNPAGSGTLVDGSVPEPAIAVLPLAGLFILTWRLRIRTATRRVV